MFNSSCQIWGKVFGNYRNFLIREIDVLCCFIIAILNLLFQTNYYGGDILFPKSSAIYDNYKYYNLADVSFSDGLVTMSILFFLSAQTRNLLRLMNDADRAIALDSTLLNDWLKVVKLTYKSRLFVDFSSFLKVDWKLTSKSRLSADFPSTVLLGLLHYCRSVLMEGPLLYAGVRAGRIDRDMNIFSYILSLFVLDIPTTPFSRRKEAHIRAVRQVRAYLLGAYLGLGLLQLVQKIFTYESNTVHSLIGMHLLDSKLCTT